MDENMTVVDQTADIDAAWDEDEAAAEAPAASETETEASEVSAQTLEAEPAKEADQPKTWTLKNRDRVWQATEEEMIELAHKGSDYDNVRQERDQLRQQKLESDPALALVKRYADRMGKTIPEYLEYCREQELIASGKTQQEAQQQIGMEKREAELSDREAAILAKENAQNSAEAEAEAQRENVQDQVSAFAAAYPGVKGESIPQEVWDMVDTGVPLVTAYTAHENKRLMAELAAERQNKANQQRTPGSLGGNTAPEMDEIDRLWNEDD